MLTSPRPIRVAVLCSRRAPGLLHLLDSPAHGRDFEVVAVVSSEPDLRETDALAARGVTVRVHDIHAFYAARGAKLTGDRRTREAYDVMTRDTLRELRTELVLLDGYLYVLTPPVLEAYPHRVLNLHFSDLTLRCEDGRPVYPGIRAVRDAIVAGQRETRATVHLVNSEPDGGPPLVRSWPFPVAPMVARARAWGAMDMLKAYAFAHQEWMLREAAGPLLSAALALVTSGRVSLDAIGVMAPHAVQPWSVDGSGPLRSPGADADVREMPARRAIAGRRRCAATTWGAVFVDRSDGVSGRRDVGRTADRLRSPLVFTPGEEGRR